MHLLAQRDATAKELRAAAEEAVAVGTHAEVDGNLDVGELPPCATRALLLLLLLLLLSSLVE